MDYRFPKENGLLVLLIVSIWTLIICMFAAYYLLMQMELQKTLTLSNKLELEVENEDGSTTVPKQEQEDQVITGRMRLSQFRKVVLGLLVGVMTLLVYLVLVKSEAKAWLSWLGMAAILFVLFNEHIAEEIRRQRLDRLSGLLSLVLIMAMALNLAVYAKQQVTDGQIHEGRARIIGYDFAQYDNANDTTTRTDLVVSWGGAWGCPNHPHTYCEAEVQGALCETDEKDDNARWLADASQQQDNSSQQQQDNSSQQQQDNSSQQQQDNSSQQQQETAEDAELEEEVVEEAEVNEELEEEVEELEEDNEETNEELQDYETYDEELEQYDEELEDCLENMEYQYYYDDDLYYDSYWDEQDWDSIWGEYVCTDLFSEDLEAGPGSYDPDTEPGLDGDDWPFINIYGDCLTCEAYIVDYFSTENFQAVQKYKKSARNYGLAATLSLLLTTVFALKQRFNPTADQEIELLSRHGPGKFGAMA